MNINGGATNMRKHRLNIIKVFLITFLLFSVYSSISAINIYAENINRNYSQNYDSQIPKKINFHESQNNIKIIDDPLYYWNSIGYS